MNTSMTSDERTSPRLATATELILEGSARRNGRNEKTRLEGILNHSTTKFGRQKVARKLALSRQKCWSQATQVRSLGATLVTSPKLWTRPSRERLVARPKKRVVTRVTKPVRVKVPQSFHPLKERLQKIRARNPGGNSCRFEMHVLSQRAQMLLQL